MRARAALLALAIIALPSAGLAQGAEPPKPWTTLAPVNLDQPVVTRHSGVFHGSPVDYTATVEAFTVPDAASQPAAKLADIAYVAARVDPRRPVLFAFNGGPIGPSNIIHMGLLGPRRAAVPDDIHDVAGIRLADNPYANLDVADLVLFDPAETGFSRAMRGVDFKSFTSVAADALELTGLILAWTKAHGRTDSPIYLVGESYGTLRAAETANQMLKAGRPLAGVILLGQAVNIVEYSQRPDNIVSYAVSLPTLAAIGWAHGKAERKGRSFEQFMAEAERYGQGEYLSVLFLGQRAPDARRQAVARKLQEYTGLPADIWMAHALKVPKILYQRSLFPGEVLGVNDARYRGPAGGGDPFGPTLRAFDTLFQSYLKDELKAGGVGLYNTENPFRGGLNDWDWGPNKSPFGDWPYVSALTEVFKAQPNFRLMVGDGYYDTQTTIGAQDYLLADSPWPADRVHSYRYQGGHMAYTIEASAKAINDDIRCMITGGGW